jgi:hypothetical protein
MSEVVLLTVLVLALLADIGWLVIRRESVLEWRLRLMKEAMVRMSITIGERLTPAFQEAGRAMKELFSDG